MKPPKPSLLLALAALAVPSLWMLYPVAATEPLGPVALSGANSSSAAVQAVPLKLDRLSPAIDHIIPANARIERVATGFKWVEGPV